MATATDYLPDAIGDYLRLPREWADTRPVDGGQELGHDPHRPARPARRDDGQGLRRRMPCRRRGDHRPRAVPRGEVRAGVGGRRPRARARPGARRPSPHGRRTGSPRPSPACRRPSTSPASPHPTARRNEPECHEPAPLESRLAESLEQLTDVAAEAGLDPAAAARRACASPPPSPSRCPAPPQAGPAPPHARPDRPRPHQRGLLRRRLPRASLARRPDRPARGPRRSRHTLAAEYAEALTEVASSAVMLGTAPIDAIAKATATSATDLAAVRPGAPGTLVQARPDGLGSAAVVVGHPPTAARGPGHGRRAPLLGTDPLPSAPDASGTPAGRAGTDGQRGPTGRRRRPQPTGARRDTRRPGRAPPAARRAGRAGEVGRGAARRARRDDRAGPRQARGPPAGGHAQGREEAGRTPGSRPRSQPAPRLRRQPRHREDDRRPARRRHLPRPRAAARRATSSRSTAASSSPGYVGQTAMKTAEVVRQGHRRRAVHRRGLRA